ncbi:phosphoenolpyruvate--protein phosphotransferase [Leptospira wolffii]|uniref:Phosphoenolpyruvate-protein phosphotransferase n=1 Tax=Leptospira wolffii TaxID=409998 RepID=A0A2M9ZDF3_9LEPT|nr:phosphoenolpyruvate--protein phosphotransferase [Leptospira wolffii]PJZ66446.1 phosphoenolpyruvate--protein phosphotransferase [Leptospira wolffii]TGK59987.1 phosphoenolpyruvate--protein phosphotransferase [Leptospira wolffii]TGK70023.1 phosphoenolpyruvate--protein phosphotransferase [Leptospira wolffii]TGK75995.1 phosphoenolpyruvate--protein phosphotransferase [Leptospira wolffii]TGL30246.1 phosphoenolpyruvate--protein phosphotransferase [Leptospira wolffii]
MNGGKRITYQGIVAFPGRFYGRAVKVGTKRRHLAHGAYIHDSQKKEELAKLAKALESSKIELKGILVQLKARPEDKELKEILETQVTITEDPGLQDSYKERILEYNENAFLAVQNTINELTDKFARLDNPFFRERSDHFQDISNRILENLLDKKEEVSFLADQSEDVILIARQLTPSQMILMDKTRIRGIATDLGGKTGHMAILARNYGIPTVVGLKEFYRNVNDFEYVFLDADTGQMVRNPTIEEVKYYGASSPINTEQKSPKKKKAVSKDGIRIRLKCNLESDTDCDIAKKADVDGVGLFRSESLFLKYQDKNVSGEEQYLAYKRIAEGMDPNPVYIRTFDIGADKFSTGEFEENPFLGNRGIRYSLQNPEWFKEQLTAILRASAYGNLSILLPMVTGLVEIRKTKELLEDCKKELSVQKEKFNKKIKIGVMVETPSAVSSMDVLAREVDFFSVGTNDLLQYLMAVDRNNVNVSNLYNPFHISFLRTLAQIVDTAWKYEKPLSICGEIASDTNFTILLFGLGFRELSVALPFVGSIRNILGSVGLKQATYLVKKVMELSENEDYDAIEAFLFSKHLEG